MTTPMKAGPQVGFDYACVPDEARARVQRLTAAIKVRLKRTVKNILATGADLEVVWASLPPRQWRPFLRAEFGWSRKTAENFRAVARRFGAKGEIIARLPLRPTVLYLLAAPSTPEAACQEALDRARAGERLTVAQVREIIDRIRGERLEQRHPFARIKGRLTASLARYIRQCEEGDLPLLADHLQQVAAELRRAPA